jgi:hypothetical protein
VLLLLAAAAAAACCCRQVKEILWQSIEILEGKLNTIEEEIIKWENNMHGGGMM